MRKKLIFEYIYNVRHSQEVHAPFPSNSIEKQAKNDVSGQRSQTVEWADPGDIFYGDHEGCGRIGRFEFEDGRRQPASGHAMRKCN